MRLADVVETSAAVAKTGGRLDKIAALAALLKRLDPDEVGIAIAFLSGTPTQGRTGIGWSLIQRAMGTAAPEPTLTLREVDAA